MGCDPWLIRKWERRFFAYEGWRPGIAGTTRQVRAVTGQAKTHNSRTLELCVRGTSAVKESNRIQSLFSTWPSILLYFSQYFNDYRFTKTRLALRMGCLRPTAKAQRLRLRGWQKDWQHHVGVIGGGEEGHLHRHVDVDVLGGYVEGRCCRGAGHSAPPVRSCRRCKAPALFRRWPGAPGAGQ